MALVRKVVEFETALRDDQDNPVMLHLTQYTGSDQELIELKMRQEYPPIDLTPYMVPVERSASPDQKVLDEDNPDYKRRIEELERNRTRWLLDYVFDVYVNVAPPYTREEVIETCKPLLEQKRKHIDIVGGDWFAVVRHVLVKDAMGYDDLIKALKNKLPLTEGEILDGMRIFRPVIQRGAAGRDNKETRPRSAKAGEPDKGEDT